MTSQPLPDWTFEPGRPSWPHHEQRSGLSGFGDRPVLHQAWCEPAADLERSRSKSRTGAVVDLVRFRAAA